MKLFKALDMIFDYTKYEMSPKKRFGRSRERDTDTENPNSPENTI